MLVIFSFTYTTWFYFYKYLLQIKSSLICFCSFLFVKYGTFLLGMARWNRLTDYSVGFFIDSIWYVM